MLEEPSLVLRFSKTFLVDLQMSSELLECFAYVSFCIFYFANILENVLKQFSHSRSLLILAQIFAPFDCLHSSWCNSSWWSWRFSVIGLNSGKFLSLYLGPFSSKVQILEKDGACLFLVQDFVYSNEPLVEEWYFSHF